jgi:hypothetical protein
MDVVHHDRDSCRMCLNHAQTDLEQLLMELDHQLRRWFAHPGNPNLHVHVAMLLTDLRWQLSQHFDYLTHDHWNIAFKRYPNLAHRLRDIHNQQQALIKSLERLAASIPKSCCSSHKIANLLSRFEEFHSALLHEEVDERWLVDVSLA